MYVCVYSVLYTLYVLYWAEQDGTHELCFCLSSVQHYCRLRSHQLALAFDPSLSNLPVT